MCKTILEDRSHSYSAPSNCQSRLPPPPERAPPPAQLSAVPLPLGGGSSQQPFTAAQSTALLLLLLIHSVSQFGCSSKSSLSLFSQSSRLPPVIGKCVSSTFPLPASPFPRSWFGFPLSSLLSTRNRGSLSLLLLPIPTPTTNPSIRLVVVSSKVRFLCVCAQLLNQPVVLRILPINDDDEDDDLLCHLISPILVSFSLG